MAPGLQEAADHYVRLRDTSRIALVVAVLALAVAGLTFGRQRISAHLRARNQVETVVKVFLIVGSTVAVLTTAGIVFSLVFEAGRFFVAVSPAEFLFGTEWSPQIALRKDQVGAQGAFGAVPLFAGTLLISVIAMCVAMPVGLMSAIYMAEYAPPRLRTVIKPILEILAGIPTVVYGFFAALTVAPFFRDTGAAVGLTISSESALAAGIVMGIMIIPFVSSLSDDVINAVPRAMREGSYGLGATQSETIRKVIIPQENVKDLQEIPDNVKDGLEIIPVKWIDEVLTIALEKQPQPLPANLADVDADVAPLAETVASTAKTRTKRQTIKH